MAFNAEEKDFFSTIFEKKIEEEGKAEEDLYETYVCWAKTVIDTKTKFWVVYWAPLKGETYKTHIFCWTT